MNSHNIEENFGNDQKYRNVCPYASDELSDKESFVEFVTNVNTSQVYLCLCCTDESYSDIDISTIAVKMNSTYCSTPKKHKVRLFRDKNIQNDKGSDNLPEYADSQIFDISGEEAYKQIPGYANSKIFDERYKSEYGEKEPFQKFDLAAQYLGVPVDNVAIIEKAKEVEKSVRVLRSRVITY